MRVLFVTDHKHLPQRIGGSELTTHELAVNLQKRSIECAVLASLKGRDLTWLVNRIKSKVTGQGFPADTYGGYKVFRGWGAVNGMAEVKSKFQPDVVVVQAGLPYLMAEKSIALGINTVVYVHDVEYHEYGGEYRQHELLSFISNSEYTSRQFEKKFGIKSTVIPPLVVPEKYRVESRREKVVFICPVVRKGKELAFRLAEANSDIPFLFVESWPTSESARALNMERANKAGNIEWLAPQQDVKKVYSQARLMLVPSIWNETWGRVVTESQLSGIPTLASSRGGIPESVGEGGVTLDPEADLEKWSFALRQFWFDTDFYNKYTERAFQHAGRDSINPEILISRFIDILERSISHSG